MHSSTIKKRGGIFLVFLFLIGIFCVNIINAAPPTTIIYGDFTTGYTLKTPTDTTLKAGEGYEFEVHAYNKTSGYPVTSGIGCYFHLYNETGKHILELYDETVSHMFDYSFEIAGDNFTIGAFTYVVQCNNTDQGGFNEVPLVVTRTGEMIDSSNNILPIALMFLSTLLFLLGFTFDKEKWMMKSFFYLCSILAGLISLNAARIMASESPGVISMSSLGLIIAIVVTLVMFLYVAVRYLVNVFVQMKKKGEIRWQY